jgi:hypothetical protein
VPGTQGPIGPAPWRRWTWPHWALAVQDLAAGRADSAARRLDFRASDVGSFDTPAIHSVPDIVEALVRLDRHDDAIPAGKRLELWAASADWKQLIGFRTRP